jgi:hypothetical protein
MGHSLDKVKLTVDQERYLVTRIRYFTQDLLGSKYCKKICKRSWTLGFNQNFSNRQELKMPIFDQKRAIPIVFCSIKFRKEVIFNHTIWPNYKLSIFHWLNIEASEELKIYHAPSALPLYYKICFMPSAHTKKKNRPGQKIRSQLNIFRNYTAADEISFMSAFYHP